MTNSNKKKPFFERGLLSFQHMFAMLGATIVVPILANMSVAVTLITAGLGTVIFHFVAKKKVPVFLGASFTYLASLIAIMGGAGEIGSPTWNDKMGGLVVAIWATGLVYVLFSFLTKAIGVQRIRKFFPAQVVGPVVIVIGMTLAPKVLYNNIIAPTLSTTPILAWQSWSTALITLLTIVLASTFTKPKSFFRVAPILLGFVVGYLYALCIGIVNFDGAFSSNRLIIFQQIPELFGFVSHLNFDWNAICLMAPLAIVTFMEHLGDISANSTICGRDFMVDPGIDKTLLGDGLSIIVGGTLGGPPTTTYGENTAILAITKNYDPKNIFWAAILAIVFGVVTVFGDFVTTIPAPVIGGASIALFGMISASGLRALIEGKVDLSNTKNLLLISIILVLGLGFGTLSFAGDFFSDGHHLKIIIAGIEISPLAICTLTGIILNIVLPEEKLPATSD